MTEKFDNIERDVEKEEKQNLDQDTRDRLMERIEKIIRREGPMKVEELAQKLSEKDVSHEKLDKLRENIQVIKKELQHEDEKRKAHGEDTLDRQKITDILEESLGDFKNQDNTGIAAALIEVNSVRDNLRDLEDRVREMSDEHGNLKKFGDVLEDLAAEVDELQEKVEEIEESGSSDTEPQDLSHIEFDLKSIKSRMSELEKEGLTEKLDQTQLRDLRRRIKKLEEKTGSRELKAFKNDIEQKIHQVEQETVKEEDFEEHLEELRTQIEDRLRQMSSEIDRAVDQGEKRLNSLEKTVEREILEDVEDTEEELSERIEEVTEIVLDNQDYMEWLESEIRRIEKEKETEVEFVQRQENLPQPAPETEEQEYTDERIEKLEETIEEKKGSDLEEKIDNLADHVISNQERIHELEEQLRAQGAKEKSVSEDITIIS